MSGLWSIIKAAFPPIGSASIGLTVEQVVMHVEVIPRDFADVIREAINGIAELRSSKDDTYGYETLYDAVSQAQDVGTRLLRYVEPENLLFLFSQSMQALGYAPIELPLSSPLANVCEQFSLSVSQQQANGNYQRHPKNRAVVLCKLKNAELLQQIIVGEQHESADHGSHKEVTWRELQTLKHDLDYLRTQVAPPQKASILTQEQIAALAKEIASGMRLPKINAPATKPDGIAIARMMERLTVRHIAVVPQCDGSTAIDIQCDQLSTTFILNKEQCAHLAALLTA